MSDIEDESKLDREAREERLGGVFWLGKSVNGKIEYPEHWTQTEIDNWHNHIKWWRED